MQVLQHTDEQLRQLGQFDSSMKQAEQAAQQVRVKDRWTGHVGMTTRAERRKEKKRKATAKASRRQQQKVGK